MSLQSVSSPRRPLSGLNEQENPPVRRVRLIFRPPKPPVRLYLSPPAPPKSPVVSFASSQIVPDDFAAISSVSSAFLSSSSLSRVRSEQDNRNIWEEMLLNEASARFFSSHVSPSVASLRSVSSSANRWESRDINRLNRQTRRERAVANRDLPAAFKSQYTLKSTMRQIQHMNDHCRHCGTWHWKENAPRGYRRREREYDFCCKAR